MTVITQKKSGETTYKLKTILMATLLLITGYGVNAQIQEQPRSVAAYEDFGHTLNIGVGPGYFGYLDQSVPFLFINYEITVARNFTLAPFIGFASFQSNQNYDYGGNYYYYRETVIPIGVKGTYYFDRLLKLNRRWDVYAALSLGYSYYDVVWQNGYDGNTNESVTPSALYLDAHIGAEYHVSRFLGIFLDLSTGVSTVGLAFHHL
jgi:hypothetical protein